MKSKEAWISNMPRRLALPEALAKQCTSLAQCGSLLWSYMVSNDFIPIEGEKPMTPYPGEEQ